MRAMLPEVTRWRVRPESDGATCAADGLGLCEMAGEGGEVGESFCGRGDLLVGDEGDADLSG